MGRLPRLRPRAPTGRRPWCPVRSWERELPTGGIPQARARRSVHLLVWHTIRSRRFGVCIASAPRLCAGPQKIRILELRQQLLGADQSRAATPVIPGPVGEMSAQFNTYLKQYLALYCNGANDVVARTAPAPQGPWSPEQLLVPSMQIPGGIYAPFLH